MDRHGNKNIVPVVSPVIMVMHLLICIRSVAVSCHVPSVSCNKAMEDMSPALWVTALHTSGLVSVLPTRDSMYVSGNVPSECRLSSHITLTDSLIAGI